MHLRLSMKRYHCCQTSRTNKNIGSACLDAVAARRARRLFCFIFQVFYCGNEKVGMLIMDVMTGFDGQGFAIREASLNLV